MIITGPRPSFAQGFARSQAEAAHPELRREPVGSWGPFLGRTGLTLFDWSGNRNHGTLTNMDPASDWVITEKGWALDFDGTDDRVDCGELILDVSKPHTLSVWLYKLSNWHDTGVMGQWLSTKGAMLYGDFFVGDEKVDYHIDGNALGSTTQLAQNTWYHVAGTFDGATARLYVNGIQENSAARTPTQPGSVQFTLATYAGIVGRFRGRLQTPSAWQRALSPSEITTLYRDPYALFRPRQRPYAVVSAPAATKPWYYYQHLSLGAA